MEREVTFGSIAIRYRMARSARRTLAISVLPDGTVDVTAPDTVPAEEVDAKVRQRAAWILRQQHHFEQFRPITPPRRYLPGETHRYLGRQYRLKVELGDEDHVGLLSGRLLVRTRYPDDREWTKVLVRRWFRQRAGVVLRERYKAAAPVTYGLAIPAPRLIVRPMEKRWGSHTLAGTIILNSRLVAARRDHIDYVIAHELCHVVEPNHSRRFFELLERFLPDWRDRKAAMDRMLS